MGNPQNFQPQVRDTTGGPNLHTYIPRADGTIVINGMTFLPQSGVPTAATIPVTVAGIPIESASHPVPVQPYLVPPGGPATPAYVMSSVPLTPQLCPYPCHYYHMPSDSSPLGYFSYTFPYYQPASVPVQTSLVQQQPMMYPSAPNATYPYQPYSPYIVQPQPIATGLPTFAIQQPAYNTIGHTGYETLNAQLATAQGLEMNKKQEMKPADDDPMRMYWVREPDSTWTQRNRVTIDSGDIGDCRWYTHEGVFYAVRLPS